MNNKKKFLFIKPQDELSELINKKANELYRQIANLNIDELELDDFGKYYFTNHHTGKRLFFSIESSADIIYSAVMKSKKKPADLSFTDYGAGLGTLFLLAGSVGFKQVYYNDYFPKWAGYARRFCENLNIRITDYISGDIEAVINYGIKNNIRFDIIASRNVVEHIYDLRKFYTKIYDSNLTDICFATTTANFNNFAMRLKHYLLHYQVEKKQFKKQREAYIRELKTEINSTDLKQLIELTRGRACEDFTNTVNAYFESKEILPVEFLYSNTCDCRTGQWAEHLITRKDYMNIIKKAGFTATYTAGFWDTHYKSSFVNLFTRGLNTIIKIIGSKGYYLSPFVKVIASKNDNA